MEERRNSNSLLAISSRWGRFYISPDKDNSRFGFGTSQNGDLYRYDKITGYYQSISPNAKDVNTPLRFNWNAGFAKDPFDKNGIYYGSQFLHKSKDKGANWDTISPDLTTNKSEYQKSDYGGLTLDISGAENYTSILSIAPSHLDENIIWVGTDDGQVQLTKNGGKTWENLTSKIKNLPNEAWIARIHASRYEKGTAWVVVNNYRKGDYNPYLFKTSDYGKNWESVLDEKNIKGYSLSFIQDPVERKLLFLGTENGLWVSIDEEIIGYNSKMDSHLYPQWILLFRKMNLLLLLVLLEELFGYWMIY